MQGYCSKECFKKWLHSKGEHNALAEASDVEARGEDEKHAARDGAIEVEDEKHAATDSS